MREGFAGKVINKNCLPAQSYFTEVYKIKKLPNGGWQLNVLTAICQEFKHINIDLIMLLFNIHEKNRVMCL